MRITRTSLIAFLKTQAVYIAFSIVVAGIFWAIGEDINPLTILVYSLTLGNLTMLPMGKASTLYLGRRFPYNWLVFLSLLSVLLLPVYLISSTLVWLIAPPSPQSLGHYVQTGWKFPILITTVFSIGFFVYETSRKRFEERNRELEQSVERESAKVESQKEELRRAREIQESLLPKEIPKVDGFDLAAAWRPAREVSGDYFDVFRLGESLIAFCVADVVGKGVSAALLMANVQAAVRAFASEHISPAELCGKVNRLLCENVATGKFVTFLFGILDCGARRLVYCNAGHPDPILVTQGKAAALNDSGAVLGVFPAWQYKDEVVELAEGDRFLVFTDGLTEAEAPDEVEFGEERIADFAARHSSQSAMELSTSLLDRVDAYCRSQFQDDATLVVVAAK
ncbi:PP2C family protein-serine/threonine phosphatase [Occallatibacter riparius]|uniref:PP2C family protein-serine/threonine phosphatase n=1 Tax=Occallatibacter riparius TaxID=1002689 RepID=A0A9J7BPY3_9BACT|nr:PP2C family protein-serine/threonine phosphatase [Occallatibacter riparius]UWZ82998.1 PP2C family protein-serine/threonine phosphatase [Occallatibacter riparius]